MQLTKYVHSPKFVTFHFHRVDDEDFYSALAADFDEVRVRLCMYMAVVFLT